MCNLGQPEILKKTLQNMLSVKYVHNQASGLFTRVVPLEVVVDQYGFFQWPMQKLTFSMQGGVRLIQYQCTNVIPK